MQSHSQKAAIQRRRLHLVSRRLQLGLIGAFASITAIGLVTQSLCLAVQLGQLEQSLPSGGPYLSAQVPGMLRTSLAVSLAIILPATLLLGMRWTHRIAGPAYRIRMHCEAVARGERPGKLSVRSDDALQDVAAAAGKVCEQLEALRDASTAQPSTNARAA